MAIARKSSLDVDRQGRTILSVELHVAKLSKEKPAIPPAPEPALKQVHPTERRSSVKKIALQPVQSIMPKTAETVVSANLAATATPEIPAAAPPRLGESPVIKDAIDTGSMDSGQKSARAQIWKLLLTDLARRFRYPALAQRRGWQGEVLLSITVYPTGELDHIHVSRSSGYDVLDRAAVDTLRHIGRLGEAERWPRAPALELLLPVVYRLTD